MGGRDCGDDTIAITDFDHNDANNLGSATLTSPDPLTGLNKLAAQVAASGIEKVSGDVIIDDRLFQQFRVPNQRLLITPIVMPEIALSSDDARLAVGRIDRVLSLSL